MMSSLVATTLFAAEETAHHEELPIAPWLIGLITLGLLMLLLAFTWSFKRHGLKHDRSVQTGKH